MNNTQKTIGMVVCIVFIVMLLYPPFYFITGSHGQPGVVYGFLFDNSAQSNVDTFLLLTQMFGVLIIGAVACLIANSTGYRNNPTGGLWRHTGENGHTFFSGPLSPFSKIYIIPNTCKYEKSDPDYFFYLGTNEKMMPKTTAARQSINGNDLAGEVCRHCKPAGME